MKAFHLALQLPANLDLSEFSRQLATEGIAHKITLEGVYQLVWVPEDNDPETVIAHFQAWQANAGNSDAGVTGPVGRFRANVRQFPLTIGLIVLNVLMVWVGLNAASGSLSGLIQALTATPYSIVGGYLIFEPVSETFGRQEYWRLIAPALLHFSWLHLAFNMLWVWELGRRVEHLHGRMRFLSLTFATAISANLVQLGLSGPSLFGGMSGVVFGYLGYCMVWDYLNPRARIGLAPAAYWVMIGFLLLGFSGLLDLLGLGALANGAHLGGLLAGAIVGLGVIQWSRWIATSGRDG